jgi:hypothetical protein
MQSAGRHAAAAAAIIYCTFAWGHQHRCILDLSANAPPAYEVFRSTDAERARGWGGSGLRKLHGTRQVMANGPFKLTVKFAPTFNRPGGVRRSGCKHEKR